MGATLEEQLLQQSSLVDLLKMVRSGELTTTALRQFAAQRFEASEPQVAAFLHHDLGFLEETDVTPQPWHPERPLSGVPIGVKDMIDVAGMPTTGGSDAYRYIPSEDATVVAKLRAAGAFITGKTNTQELAFGVVTEPTRNPWGLSHIPGGSSGGSAAAVAAGMTFAALGTDTGGSVRIPAACCNIVGFKPSVGRISKHGVMPLSTTFDHVGVLTRSVADARLLYNLLQGFDANELTTSGVARFREKPPGERRLAIPWSYFRETIRPETMSVFQAAVDKLRAQGWDISEIDLDPFSLWKSLQLHIRLPEAYAFHQDVLEGPGRSLLKGDLAARLDPGKQFSALDYVTAQQTRLRKIQEYAAKLAGFDGLLMPTLLCPIPEAGVVNVELANGTLPVWEALTYLTTPWNVLGFPAISLPGDFDSTGMPVGIQLVGLSGEDDYLLDLAEEMEQAVGGWRGLASPRN
ncbi:amidase [Alicyclobacillus ferrooxydans]|uniref:amidase n=1 Tax=Alicyclobacillus ferrooxydans TaxID=471514 RepID=UPI0006D59475|nr:amidase [Alicyclobacillus ferrooxydans]